MTVENDAGLGRLRAAFGASEREVDEGILKVCRMNDMFLGGFLGALSAALPGEDTQDRVCEVLPDLTQAWRDFAALGALACVAVDAGHPLPEGQRAAFSTLMTRHAPTLRGLFETLETVEGSAAARLPGTGFAAFVAREALEEGCRHLNVPVGSTHTSREVAGQLTPLLRMV